jgi:hypothetical protein
LEKLKVTQTFNDLRASQDRCSECGTLNVPNTGAYYNYQPVTLSGVSLSAGSHVLRLVMDTNGSGTGWSSVGNFNYFTLTAPSPTLSAPTSLAANAPYPNRVDLSWTDGNSNELGFQIQRSADGGGSWPVTFNVRANTTFYTDTTAEAGTSYKYRVIAVNAR